MISLGCLTDILYLFSEYYKTVVRMLKTESSFTHLRNIAPETHRSDLFDEDILYRPPILTQKSAKKVSADRKTVASPGKLYNARQPLLLRKNKDNSVTITNNSITSKGQA
jgi:hypothetical protein